MITNKAAAPAVHMTEAIKLFQIRHKSLVSMSVQCYDIISSVLAMYITYIAYHSYQRELKLVSK